MPTTNVGSSNDVGRAQLKPIASSQDTSMIRLPGPERGEVVVVQEGQRRVGVLQHAVDDDVVLGKIAGERHPAVVW